MPTRVIVADHNDYAASAAGASALGRLRLRAIMRTSYPWADAIVAVSAGVAESVARFSGIGRMGIDVIHNPVPLPTPGELSGGTAEAPEWAAHAGPRLIAVGSFKEQKGFDDLLAAFAIVRDSVDARLLILGEGDLRSQLEAKRASLGLDSSVEMPGFVFNPHAYLSRASLFILSSRWEGLPTAMIEALGCGTPVVATDCPSGPREILAAGGYGALVPVGDPGALASGILAALTAPHDSARLIARASDFSVEAAVDKYLRLLLPPSGA